MISPTPSLQTTPSMPSMVVFDTNTCKQSTETTGVSVSSYNCSCIDDFSMPFAEDAEKVSQPISVIKPEFSSPDKFLIPPSSTIFYSLRAPPSIL